MSGALRSFAALVVVLLVGGFLVVSLDPRHADEGLPAAMASPSPAGTRAGCPPGSTPDASGAADAPRPPALNDAAASSSVAFDRASGRIVSVSVDAAGEYATWLFDVCTNTWAQAHPETEPSVPESGWAWAPMVYDAAAHRTLFILDGYVWAYDAAADDWLILAPPPSQEPPFDPDDPGPFEPSRARVVYDPTRARVMAYDLGQLRRLWTFDTGSGSWQQVTQGQMLDPGAYPLHELVAFDPSVDGLVAFNMGRTAVFDMASGSWTPSAAQSPPIAYAGYLSNGGQVVYDEATERTVVVGMDGLVIAYDASTDTWEPLFGTPRGESAPGDGRVVADPVGEAPPGFSDQGGRHDFRLVYDPLNERIVVLGGSISNGEGWRPADEVAAFDTRTREWTELLPPSQPAG